MSIPVLLVHLAMTPAITPVITVLPAVVVCTAALWDRLHLLAFVMQGTSANNLRRLLHQTRRMMQMFVHKVWLMLRSWNIQYNLSQSLIILQWKLYQSHQPYALYNNKLQILVSTCHWKLYFLLRVILSRRHCYPYWLSTRNLWGYNRSKEQFRMHTLYCWEVLWNQRINRSRRFVSNSKCLEASLAIFIYWFR